jgi:endogenous inhibitor of DNA gyrase (YacG/DUF329 family)
VRKIVCDICGQEYEHWQHMSKFCSKQCYHKAMYFRSKDRVLSKDYQLRKTYGISLQEFEQMVEDQNNLCAICKEPEVMKQKDGRLFPLCVDHNHETGQIRDLLCRRCNMALGLLREDTSLVDAMKQYIAKFSQLKAIKEKN